MPPRAPSGRNCFLCAGHLETHDLSLESPVSHLVAWRENSLPYYQHRYRRGAPGTPADSSQTYPPPKNPSERSCPLHDGHPARKNSSREISVPCPVACDEKTIPYYEHRRWNVKPGNRVEFSQVWNNLKFLAGRSFRLHGEHFDMRELFHL